jgi:hypothetical protein
MRVCVTISWLAAGAVGVSGLGGSVREFWDLLANGITWERFGSRLA